MNDTHGEHIQQSLAAAKESRQRMNACLDDARTDLVDVVDGGISDGVSRADLNHLDSARVYMNRAVELLTAADQFIGHAQEHVALAFSTNVVPLGAATTPRAVWHDWR